MAEKVALTGAMETLCITLYAKAEESRRPDSLLQDHFAAEAVAKMDYDFARLGVRPDDMIGIAIRAHAFDTWVRGFIAEHPDATILNLGCGLDSRVYRIDPPARIAWFDVDFPEVIDLRRRLYPARGGTTLIPSSVTAPGWLEAVPAKPPVMVVAEGLMPYLAVDEAPQLLRRIAAHFSGGDIVFDGYNWLGLRLIAANRMIRATGATLHWALDDPHDLEAEVPGLRLVWEQATYGDAEQRAHFSWPGRLTLLVFMAFPTLRRIGRLLRYRF